MCGASVLAGLEMGEGEVEAHPGQVGVAGEHGAEPRDGGLPVAPLERDRAVQEVEVVDVPFVRLNALEQEFGVVWRTLRERCPRGLDQRFGGEGGCWRLLRLGPRRFRGNRLDQDKREEQGGEQSRILVHVHLPTASGARKGDHTIRSRSGEAGCGTSRRSSVAVTRSGRYGATTVRVTSGSVASRRRSRPFR